MANYSIKVSRQYLKKTELFKGVRGTNVIDIMQTQKQIGDNMNCLLKDQSKYIVCNGRIINKPYDGTCTIEQFARENMENSMTVNEYIKNNGGDSMAFEKKKGGKGGCK